MLERHIANASEQNFYSVDFRLLLWLEVSVFHFARRDNVEVNSQRVLTIVSKRTASGMEWFSYGMNPKVQHQA